MNNMKQQAFDLLNELFNSTCRNAWGGKGYLADRIRREVGCTLKQAKEFHAEWAEANNQ